jgi:hypothetical protein
MDKLAKVKINSLAAPKSFLLADIEIKLTTTSLGMCLNSAAISFLCLASVPCLLLIVGASEHCPLCIY